MWYTILVIKEFFMQSIPKDKEGKIIFKDIDYTKFAKEIKEKQSFTKEDYIDVLTVLRNRQSKVEYYYSEQDLADKLSRTWIGYPPDDTELRNLIQATGNTLTELIDGLKNSDKFDNSQSVQQKITESLIKFFNSQQKLDKSTEFLIDSLNAFENTVKRNDTLKHMNRDGMTAQRVYTSFGRIVENANECANGLCENFSKAIDLGVPLS